MSLHLTRPSNEVLRSLATAGRTDALTYAPVGVSTVATPPAGYRRGEWSRSLGRGAHVFDLAADAIRHWNVHRGAGLIVEADGPPVVGSVVAMAAPLPIGYIDVVCRVVAVVDQPDRFGFTYGTLSVHPEQGEESFTVVRSQDDLVRLTIVAVSRPRHPLARLAPPIARRLQAAATNRYLGAMQAAVG